MKLTNSISIISNITDNMVPAALNKIHFYGLSAVGAAAGEGSLQQNVNGLTAETLLIHPRYSI